VGRGVLFSPTILGAISLTILSPFAVRGISLTPVWALVDSLLLSSLQAAGGWDWVNKTNEHTCRPLMDHSVSPVHQL